MKKLLLLSLITLFTYSISFAQIPLDGLVGYYKLNEGSYVDETESNLDLESANIGGVLLPVEDRFGEENGALLFANEYLNLASNPNAFNFDDDSTFSICGWFKLGTSVPDWTGLFNNWAGFDIGGYYLGINPAGQLLRWNVNLGGTPIDSDPIPIGSWTHVVVLYDGVDAKMYINGVLAGTETYGVGILPSNLPFSVGAQADLPTLQFAGELDDILVYDRALTESEVTDIFVVLSIEDVEKFSAEIQLAPNPTVNTFSINYNRTLGTITSYSVVDVLGKTIIAGKLKPLTNEIDLTPYNTGTYFVNFTTIDGLTVTKRIVKN